MVPERIPGTLTTSSSSPMDSYGRDPICRPSEPRFLSSKASFTTMIAVTTSHHNRNFTINGAAIRKVGQKRGSRRYEREPLSAEMHFLDRDFWPGTTSG